MRHVPNRLISPPTRTLYDDDARDCKEKEHNIECISSYKIGRYLWKNKYICNTCGNEWYEEDEEDVG